MSEVKRYEEEYRGVGERDDGSYVLYEDYAELKAQRDALAAENAALKSSRAVLAENTLEACNAIASAGFRNEAIMRGLMASTGNGNKYPKPITTLVDEALRKIETPAIAAYLNSVRAEGVEMLAANHQRIVDTLNGDSLFADGERRHAAIAAAAVHFAAQLRAGEPS